MTFMEPEVTYGDWYEVTTDGIDFIPVDVVSKADGLTIGQFATEHDPAWDTIAELVRPYVNGTPTCIRRLSGFGARLSAPGYLDCTEWSVFPTEQEARDYLRDELGTDDDEEADDA
jgi:hypothetical protein